MKCRDCYDVDPDEFRVESVGALHQLTDKNPPGEPFKPKRHPIGFDIRPGAHARQRYRKWRKVSRIK